MKTRSTSKLTVNSRGTTLRQFTIVLELRTPEDAVNGVYVTFTRDRDDSSDFPPWMQITRKDWNDMGQPKQITVTVEPGDLLNKGDDG